jgi:hypothetical protein
MTPDEIKEIRTQIATDGSVVFARLVSTLLDEIERLRSALEEIESYVPGKRELDVDEKFQAIAREVLEGEKK